MKKITIGIIITIEIFLFSSSVQGTAPYKVSYSGFLTAGNSDYINQFVGLLAGEKVHWNFRTYNDPFKVRLSAGSSILSINKTSDNSQFEVTSVTIGDFFNVYFSNVDTTESGSYELNISVNPIPSSISGFNLFILLGVISLTAIIIKKKSWFDV